MKVYPAPRRRLDFADGLFAGFIAALMLFAALVLVSL